MASSASLQKFLPSKSFLSKINSIKTAAIREQKLKMVDRIAKELELVTYFHDRVPETINDHYWAKLLRTRNISERVAMIEYFAVTEKRKNDDLEMKRKNQEEFLAKMVQEKAKYDAGLMGYGPGLYQEVKNPFRGVKQINFLEGYRQFTTRMLAETPKIAFDCQFFPSMTVRNASRISSQVELAVVENREKFRRPFHFEFLNLNVKDPVTAEPLKATVDHLLTLYPHQQILPDVYSDMHYKPRDPNVYYVTRYAKRFFEGPLDPTKTIIIPVTHDNQEESVDVIRKYRFTPIYLPVRKYVKWQVGQFYMPIPNILRTLQKVAETGGNWEAAIGENIALRHRITIEERREIQQEHYDQKQEKIRQRKEIIKMLEENVKESSMDDVEARILPQLAAG